MLIVHAVYIQIRVSESDIYIALLVKKESGSQSYIFNAHI